MWIQPGMNHIVACCDVVSYNATKLEVVNDKYAWAPRTRKFLFSIHFHFRLVHSTVVLNDTPISDFDDYQPANLEFATLTLPDGAAVLPLVSSLNFQPHHWYNLCFKRVATQSEQGTEDTCIPVRPCECDCESRTDDAPWLRILVNASLKTDTVHLRLLSKFSPDTPLRIRYNLILQSNRYYEKCNVVDQTSPNDEEDDEQRNEREMRERHCNREPSIVANHINPSEAFQFPKKRLHGLPFHILLTINVTDSRKYWGYDIVHTLDPIRVDEDEEGSGHFGQWITVPLPTPRIEKDRPIVDWDGVDSGRICPLIHQVDCEKSSTCSGAGSQKPGLVTASTIGLIVVLSRLLS